MCVTFQCIYSKDGFQGLIQGEGGGHSRCKPPPPPSPTQPCIETFYLAGPDCSPSESPSPPAVVSRGRGVVKGVCLLALVRCVVSSAFHCLYLALQEHQSQGREAVCLNRRLPLMEKSLWLQTIVSACVCHLSVHSKDGF